MIMDIDTAKDVLRVDGSYFDQQITDYLNTLPEYFMNATGKDWTADDPVHPLALTAAKFLLMLWFDPDSPDADRLQQSIDGLLTLLTAMARPDSNE